MAIESTEGFEFMEHVVQKTRLKKVLYVVLEEEATNRAIEVLQQRYDKEDLSWRADGFHEVVVCHRSYFKKTCQGK